MAITTKTQKIVILVVALLLVGAVAGLAVSRFRTSETPAPEFTPPHFDEQAKPGTPQEVGEYFDTLPFEIKDGTCTVALDANPGVEKARDLMVFITSSEENKVWIRVVLYDGDQQVVGESGLIRPGEYVEAVTLNKDVPAGESLVAKILTYEPDTYYSKGSATITVKVR